MILQWYMATWQILPYGSKHCW